MKRDGIFTCKNKILREAQIVSMATSEHQKHIMHVSKHRALLMIGRVSFLFASCKKNYTCRCYVGTVQSFALNHPDTVTYDIHTTTRSNAENECNKKQTDFNATATNYYMTGCGL